MTSVGIGILLSIVAMLSWGFGDFLIQKNTRKIGNWETLFFITFFGAVVLLPFCFREVIAVLSDLGNGGMTLLIACVTLFIAAIVDFEALRQGKLAVIEPVWSFEIPVTSALAFFILGEKVTVLELILVALLVVFLILVSFNQNRFSKKFLLEKGVVLAFVGALFMGSANFFVGWGARLTDPVTINFIVDAFLMLICLAVLLFRGNYKKTVSDMKNNLGTLLPMSIADKVAWLAFAGAMVLAPIAISTALSQSYIIIAVILGMTINKEKLYRHQWLGMFGAIATAIALALITSH
ncbi:MAG: DMT family transporter [Patescibacteria group bacterium]